MLRVREDGGTFGSLVVYLLLLCMRLSPVDVIRTTTPNWASAAVLMHLSQQIKNQPMRD